MYKKNSQGFTILEILVVLVIIAFLGITTIPSTAMIRKHEVKKIAKELSIDLSTQRMRAMTTSDTNYFIELVEYLTEGYYYTYRLTPANITASHTRGQNKESTPNIHISLRTSPGGISITTPAAVQFDRRGYMMNAANTDIYQLFIDVEYDDQKAEVIFDGVTGHYTIKQ